MLKFLRLSYPILVLAPLVMWRIHAMSAHPPSAAPLWLEATVGVLAVYGVVCAFAIERLFSKDPAASRLRAKGTVPEQVVALTGLTMMLSPAAWAFLVSFVGLPGPQLAWYAVGSTFGVAFWGWRYRDVIYAR